MADLLEPVDFHRRNFVIGEKGHILRQGMEAVPALPAERTPRNESENPYIDDRQNGRIPVRFRGEDG